MVMAPQAFPAPQPFPTPQPDPQTYGLSPTERGPFMQPYLPPPTQFMSPATPPAGGSLLDRMTAVMGSSAAPDNTLTLDDAMAQTDKAIARLQQVNPELAQQLQSQRTNVDQTQDDGPGFWGSVLQTVASSPLGKALEFISRPAHIIPEILTDSEDGVWKNIGDALSGHSDASMIDVMDKYGILSGHDMFSSIAQSIVSFGLDMAVDPTTYITMGLGSVGRAAATRVGAEAVFKSTMLTKGATALDDLAARAGESLGIDLATATAEESRGAALNLLLHNVTEQSASMSRLGRWGALTKDLSVVDRDFVGGPLSLALKEGDREIVNGAIRSMDNAHKLIGKFGLQRIGPEMAEAAGIDLEATKGVLQGMKSTGMFGSRAEYMAGRYASALEGGVRFSFPGIRIITPALWGTSKLDFSLGRRFFSGLSGQLRIMKAVESGALEGSVGLEALQAATEGGWSKLASVTPQVAQMFGDGVSGRVGTAFAQASWQIGGITRNLGSFALVRGGGFGGQLATDARKTVNTMKKALQGEAISIETQNRFAPSILQDGADQGLLLNEVGDPIKKWNGGTLSQPAVQRTLHANERKVLADTGDDMLVIKLLEGLPSEEAQAMGADKWYDMLADNIRQQGLPEDQMTSMLQKNEARRALVKEAEDKATPEALYAARLYRVISNQTRTMRNELTGHVADSTIRTADRAVINPANRQVVETGHAAQHGRTFELEQRLESAADTPGFGLEHITDSEFGRGYAVREAEEASPFPENPKGGGPLSPEPDGPSGMLPPKLEPPTLPTLDRAAQPADELKFTPELDKVKQDLRDSIGLTPKKDVRWDQPDTMTAEELQDAWDPLERIAPKEYDETHGGSAAAFRDMLEKEGQKERVRIVYDPDTGEYMMIDGHHRVDVMKGTGKRLHVEWVPDPETIADARAGGLPVMKPAGGTRLTHAEEQAAQTDFVQNLLDAMENGDTAKLVDLTDEGPMKVGNFTEARDVELSADVRQLAAAFGVPEDHLDAIDSFAQIEALDPKWQEMLGPYAKLDELPSEVDSEYWAAKLDSIDAWHMSRHSDDPRVKEWLRRSQGLDWAEKDELAGHIFGDPLSEDSAWGLMPPSDYLEIMGPGALDAEMSSMDEILGEALGKRAANEPRFRDIVGKTFVQNPEPETTVAKFKEPLGRPRKRAVVAMDNPVYINKDAEKLIAQGKRPVADMSDVYADADKFATETMKATSEVWDEKIPALLADSKKWAKVDPGVQEVLRGMGLDPEGMTQEMKRVTLEAQASLHARLKTQFMREMGHDGVLIQEEGKLRGVVFDGGLTTGQKAPIWELSQDAPVDMPDLGFYHRRMTPEVHELMRGKPGFIERRTPEEWDAAMSRETKDMTYSEAEAHIRQSLRERGFAIGDDYQVLDRDISRNINAYVDGMANDAGSVFLGREAKRLERLGLTRSPYVSKFVGPRYEGTPSKAFMNQGGWLSKQSEKLWGISQKVARIEQRDAKAGQREVEHLQTTVAQLHERLQNSLDKQSEMTARALAGSYNPESDLGSMTREEVERYMARVNKSLAKVDAEDLGDGLFKFSNSKRDYYFTKTEDGRVAAYRWRDKNTGNVETMRLPDPEYKGQGYTLMKQDFQDHGITTLEALRKDIRNQNLSPQATELRRRYAQELLENLKPGLRKQLDNRNDELAHAAMRMDWQTQTMRDVMEEWNRIRFGTEARVAEPKVALHIGDPNQVGMSKVMLPGLDGMYMPASMADEMNFAARGYKHLNEFQKTWRRFLSFWKEWATWAWPGFHVRNAMGGWFNNWLGGVQYEDYVETFRMMRARREIETGAEGEAAKWSTRKLSKEFLSKHGLKQYYFGFEPTYGDLSDLMVKNGINAANSRSFGEARIGAELLDKEMERPANSPWTVLDTAMGRSTTVGKPGRFIAGKLRGTGEMTENMLRGASFLQGMKQMDGDFMGAHLFTMMRHGDYGDLSDWEYGAVRDVLPFYKWMRTNTPLQIHTLFEKPGKLMAVLHAREAAWQAVGLDDEDQKKLPAWMQEGLVVPTPGSTSEAMNLVTADLPMNDLYQGAGEFFSQALPLLRPFLESYVTEKSLFTGKPIEGAPVAVPWVPTFMGKMLQHIGIGKVGATGQYFIDDKLQNVLGVVPVFSRFRNWIYEEPTRSHLRAGTIVSTMAGIGLRPFGETDMRNEELRFYYGQVLPQIEYLKDMGYPVPTTEDLNNMYGASNNVLLAAGVNPQGGL